jgi:hypothetical protein
MTGLELDHLLVCAAQLRSALHRTCTPDARPRHLVPWPSIILGFHVLKNPTEFRVLGSAQRSGKRFRSTRNSNFRLAVGSNPAVSRHSTGHATQNRTTTFSLNYASFLSRRSRYRIGAKNSGRFVRALGWVQFLADCASVWALYLLLADSDPTQYQIRTEQSICHQWTQNQGQMEPTIRGKLSMLSDICGVRNGTGTLRWRWGTASPQGLSWSRRRHCRITTGSRRMSRTCLDKAASPTVVIARTQAIRVCKRV